MATKPTVVELRAACAQGLLMNVERLILRSEDWGKFNFEGARDSFQTAAFLFKAFETLPIEILPDSEVSSIRDAVQAVVQDMQSIDNFNITSGNPTETQANLLSNLKSRVDALQRASFNLLPYLAYHRGDIQAKLSAIENAVSKAERLFDEGKQSIDEKVKLLEEAIDAVRTAAAEAGAAVFTKDFFEEARDVSEAAGKWLGAAAVLATLAVIAAVAMLWLHPPVDASMPYLLQHTVSKLVVIGGLVTGAIWCGSIYRALRHQVVVNRHRGNALKTFQAFTVAAGDNQDVRSAVLLETTRSIFAVVPSGFLNATETNSDGGFKAADAVRALGKG